MKSFFTIGNIRLNKLLCFSGVDHWSSLKIESVTDSLKKLPPLQDMLEEKALTDWSLSHDGTTHKGQGIVTRVESEIKISCTDEPYMRIDLTLRITTPVLSNRSDC
jgi:hypothetical protein